MPISITNQGPLRQNNSTLQQHNRIPKLPVKRRRSLDLKYDFIKESNQSKSSNTNDENQPPNIIPGLKENHIFYNQSKGIAKSTKTKIGTKSTKTGTESTKTEPESTVRIALNKSVDALSFVK